MISDCRFGQFVALACFVFLGGLGRVSTDWLLEPAAFDLFEGLAFGFGDKGPEDSNRIAQNRP